MEDATQPKLTLPSIALVVGVAAAGVLLTVAVGPAAANHGSDSGNYTIVLPEPSDHLPGDQNPENASMQNFAQSGELFEQAGAPEGFETLDYLETGNPEIDYSDCDSPNTAVFGIDRGNNNTGTQTDTDPLQHMKDSRFREHEIEVDFYSTEDFGGDPTYINPEDAIVSVQGAGSSDGPCFTMPTEPGWYQVNGMIRGTTADGEVVEIESKSHYFPICEGCHDEDTAREKLGKPPSQRDDGSDDEETTPTPTATATPTPTESDETDDGGDETPTPTETATPTPTDDGGETGEEGDDGATGVDDSDSTGGDAELTPTPGDGPGFTGLAALLALLAAALLAHRR
jgi:PGF-CTERM protein